MLEIKIFSKNQLKENLELLRNAYIKIDGYPDNDFVTKMILNANIVGAAIENEKVIGIGRIVGDGIRFGLIVDLVVDKEHRKKGIGTKLLLALARATDAQFVVTYNDPRFPWLKDFYKKAGFREEKGAWVFKWE